MTLGGELHTDIHANVPAIHILCTSGNQSIGMVFATSARRKIHVQQQLE